MPPAKTKNAKPAATATKKSVSKPAPKSKAKAPQRKSTTKPKTTAAKSPKAATKTTKGKPTAGGPVDIEKTIEALMQQLAPDFKFDSSAVKNIRTAAEKYLSTKASAATKIGSSKQTPTKKSSAKASKKSVDDVEQNTVEYLIQQIAPGVTFDASAIAEIRDAANAYVSGAPKRKIEKKQKK